MAPEISIHLILTGFSCDPDEITTLTNIEPAKVWRTGDPITPNSSSYVRKENGWRVSSQIDRTIASGEYIAFEEYVKSTLDQLQIGWQPLVDLCKRYDAELACAIYLYFEGQSPAIHFDKEIIQRIAALNAEIDIDIYVLPNENEKETES